MFSTDKPHRIPRLFFLAAFLSAPTAAGAITWTPELAVEGRYDDNVVRTAKGFEELVTVASPGLRFLYASDISWCEVRGGRSFVSYTHGPSIILSDRASLKGAYAPSRTEAIALQFKYNRTTEPIEIDDEEGIVMRGRTSRTRGEALASLYRGEMMLRSRDWTYEDSDLGEGTARSAALRLFPVRSNSTIGIVGYRRRELNVDRAGLTTDVGTVGIRRWASERMVGELEVGVAETRFQNGAPAERDFAVAAGVGRSRTVGKQNIGGRVRIGHDLTTTGLAEVELMWPTKRVTARYERLLDNEGGLFREPTRTNRVGMEFRSVIDNSLRLNLAGSYGRYERFRGAGWRANLYRFTAGLSIPIQSWMYLRTAYAYYHEDLPERTVDRMIHRNRLALSLNVGVPLAAGHPIPGDPFGTWRPPLWSPQ